MKVLTKIVFAAIVFASAATVQTRAQEKTRGEKLPDAGKLQSAKKLLVIISAKPDYDKAEIEVVVANKSDFNVAQTSVTVRALPFRAFSTQVGLNASFMETHILPTIKSKTEGFSLGKEATARQFTLLEWASAAQQVELKANPQKTLMFKLPGKFVPGRNSESKSFYPIPAAYITGFSYVAYIPDLTFKDSSFFVELSVKGKNGEAPRQAETFVPPQND